MAVIPSKRVIFGGAFVPVWLALPQCETANLGLFDLCHVDLLKRGVRLRLQC